MSDDSDPVEDLAADVSDRDGDPFEYLSDPDADRGVGGEVADGRRGSSRTDADPADGARIGDDTPEGSGDPLGTEDGVFERMDPGRLDDDSVWEDLADAEARGPVAEAAKRTYAEVSKHRFCEGCEHFAAPPGATCSHEGTEILEFVDMETVRVVDCPVVAERRELERQV